MIKKVHKMYCMIRRLSSLRQMTLTTLYAETLMVQRLELFNSERNKLYYTVSRYIHVCVYMVKTGSNEGYARRICLSTVDIIINTRVIKRMFVSQFVVVDVGVINYTFFLLQIFCFFFIRANKPSRLRRRRRRKMTSFWC